MRVKPAGHSWVQTGILQLLPLFSHAREAGGASGFLAAGLAEWMRAFTREGGRKEGVTMRLRGSSSASSYV